MLNNPFCYTPSGRIADAAAELTERISRSEVLHPLFAPGKMLGILEVLAKNGEHLFLYAFSGLAGGKAVLEGFVPPIFDSSSVNLNSGSAEESQRLQRWLFSQYRVVNGMGRESSILDIFAERGLVPPGGTGECAGPKLLDYALRNGLEPLEIGEFWYGAAPSGEVRRQGCFYPSCTGKCGPLLGWMMQGLDVAPNPLESDAVWALDEPVVLFEDRYIIVAVKPAGMLSVPGRSERTSLQEWLSVRCGAPVFPCHRLDMDTSGIIVFAKDVASQVVLQRQFGNREVSKYYLALLVPGVSVPPKGKIYLPLMADWYDRPRQKVDFDAGRPAVTEYEILKNYDDGSSLVKLTPYTGRTHQLRVHCAHQSGLGRAIAGDRLYGGAAAPDESDSRPSRLMLHASYISFRHPATSARMTFENRADF